MTTIEATASVTADHRLVLNTSAPTEIAPGEHRVLVMIQPKSEKQATEQLLFCPHPVGPVSEDTTFSREQLYGDDGR